MKANHKLAGDQYLADAGDLLGGIATACKVVLTGVVIGAIWYVCVGLRA